MDERVAGWSCGDGEASRSRPGCLGRERPDQVVVEVERGESET